MSMTAMPSAPYKYVSTPNAVRSSSKTIKFQASNGTKFTPITSNNIAKIDIRSNGFLCGNESHIKFSIKNLSNQTVALDPMATCVIDRVRVLSGSVVLSDISGYAELASHLVLTSSTDDLVRVLAICSGFDPEQDDFASGSGLNVLATTASATYSVPLLAGILSGSKYVPLEFLAGGLTLEIYFQTSFFKAFNTQITGSPPTTTLQYEIENLEYVAKIVQIDDDASMNSLKQLQLTQGLKIKSYDWTLHQNSIAINTGTAVLNIPARNMSLKSLVMLLTHQAPSAIITGIQSLRDNVSSYFVRIGNTQYPIGEINVSDTNLTESFSEIMKCYNSGGLYNVLGTTAMKQASYINTGKTAGELRTIGCFAMGISLENYGESDLFSGLDTATLSLPINFNVKFSGTGASQGLNSLTYAQYDVVYTIMPNGMVQVDY